MSWEFFAQTPLNTHKSLAQFICFNVLVITVKQTELRRTFRAQALEPQAYQHPNLCRNWKHLKVFENSFEMLQGCMKYWNYRSIFLGVFFLQKWESLVWTADCYWETSIKRQHGFQHPTSPKHTCTIFLYYLFVFLSSLLPSNRCNSEKYRGSRWERPELSQSPHIHKQPRHQEHESRRGKINRRLTGKCKCFALKKALLWIILTQYFIMV